MNTPQAHTPTDPTRFCAEQTLARLAHYLPAQAPLKDFIHHNTLHAFQDLPFAQALARASTVFGYKVYLTLDDYRAHHDSGRISTEVLDRVIGERYGAAQRPAWRKRLLQGRYPAEAAPRIGALRGLWRSTRGLDLDARVQPLLFRMLCSYLDQGISIWKFPVWHRGFLDSLREMERLSYTSVFRRERARQLLLDERTTIPDLLGRLVGEPAQFEHYLFDQQFAHPGWSGMVSTIEHAPQTLLDTRRISLHDLVLFELLLEIDALDAEFGSDWQPLSQQAKPLPEPLFAPSPVSEHMAVLALWHEAFEWSYYDDVLRGLSRAPHIARARPPAAAPTRSFQALFCIDDRECSLRRHLEQADPECATYGTPGFFGVEFFYKPQHGKFFTKLCPAPVTPKHLIKEIGSGAARGRDPHFGAHSHRLFRGWLVAHTLGYWSALKLALTVLRPRMSPATSTSFRHMAPSARLHIENDNPLHTEGGLQVGFTVDEMAERVEKLLTSIGLVRDFAPLVYVIGHGSSSVNNPHYAAYDCGACCGRPGSVNARVLCVMANHPEVRALLRSRGLDIPDTTQFVGGLHDTSRDEVAFYDEDALSIDNAMRHARHGQQFSQALTNNAKERARRFESIDLALPKARAHEHMKRRSVSLFEPRPELNHATNALCIVGRRELTQSLFLDRRAFMNSYDYRVDPRGEHLFGILKAAAPVCGGINLEYFFSHMDTHKLGAGTKLPHNVMGLIGVANGIDGDLRPGLPSQMTEVHEPVRLLLVVEHFAEIVQQVMARHAATHEWFGNEWVHLAVIHPETRAIEVLREGRFEPYEPAQTSLPFAESLDALATRHRDNLPVHLFH